MFERIGEEISYHALIIHTTGLPVGWEFFNLALYMKEEVGKGGGGGRYPCHRHSGNQLDAVHSGITFACLAVVMSFCQIDLLGSFIHFGRWLSHEEGWIICLAV